MDDRSRLAQYAGYDAMERQMGIGTGQPLNPVTLAIMASHATLNRYQRWRTAARFNPPTPATGGFPYFNRGRP